MAKRVPDDDGSNLPPLEFTTTDFTDDPGTMAYHLIELARRLGAHPGVHGARLYLTVERDMERAEAEDMTLPQMLREMRAICVERGLLGDSPETDHQSKAPAKQNPDKAQRPDVIGVVGLLAGVQTPNLPLSRLKAYESLNRAIEENPELKGEPRKKVWLWLEKHDPDADYKLPRFGTWTSYIRECRRAQRGVVATPRAGRPHGSSVVRRDQL